MNASIWGTVDLDDAFVESVKKNGILVPVVVSVDGVTILSGHRRVAAAIQIGLESVPTVNDDEADSNDAQILKLIEYNKMRVLTNAQVCLAAAMQAKIVERSSPKAAVVGSVARTLGVSEKTAGEAIAVGAKIVDMEETGATEGARELRKTVNRNGFRKAKESIMEQAKPKGKTNTNPVVHKLNGLIGTIDTVRISIDQVTAMSGMCDEADTALRHLDDARKKLASWKDRIKTHQAK